MYLEAPNNPSEWPLKSLFLGGGISNCVDWQNEMKWLLEKPLPDVLIVNPRRYSFDMSDPSQSELQIEWEFKYLDLSTAILFWFPKETLCPITLYELGSWSMTKKPIFVGTHPEYKRCDDVRIQTRLKRPEVTVVHTLEDLADQAIAYFRG